MRAIREPLEIVDWERFHLGKRIMIAKDADKASGKDLHEEVEVSLDGELTETHQPRRLNTIFAVQVIALLPSSTLWEEPPKCPSICHQVYMLKK